MITQTLHPHPNPLPSRERELSRVQSNYSTPEKVGAEENFGLIPSPLRGEG